MNGEIASDGGDFSLQPENVVLVGGEAELETPVSMVAEGKGDVEGGRSKFGPWLVTSRIRQPRIPRVSIKGRREVEKEKVHGPSSSDPYSSSPLVTSLTPTTSSPNSSPESDGWQKPTNVARQQSPGVSNNISTARWVFLLLGLWLLAHWAIKWSWASLKISAQRTCIWWTMALVR